MRKQDRTTLEKLQAELREAVTLEREAVLRARAATALVESIKLQIIDAEHDSDARGPIRDR